MTRRKQRNSSLSFSYTCGTLEYTTGTMWNITCSQAGKRVETSRSNSGRLKSHPGSRPVPPFRPLPPPPSTSLRASAAVQTLPAPSMIAVPAFQALPQSILRAANAQPRPPAPQVFQAALQMANRRFQVKYNHHGVVFF